MRAAVDRPRGDDRPCADHHAGPGPGVGPAERRAVAGHQDGEGDAEHQVADGEAGELGEADDPRGDREEQAGADRQRLDSLRAGRRGDGFRVFAQGQDVRMVLHTLG